LNIIFVLFYLNCIIIIIIFIISENLRQRLVRSTMRHQELMTAHNHTEHTLLTALQECSYGLQVSIAMLLQDRDIRMIPSDVIGIAQKYAFNNERLIQQQQQLSGKQLMQQHTTTTTTITTTTMGQATSAEAAEEGANVT
jgi:hypothetical protein